MATTPQIRESLSAHASEASATFGYLSTQHPPYDPNWPIIDNNLSLLRLAWEHTTDGDLDGAQAALDRISW